MRMDSTRGLRRFWSGRQIDASQCEQQSGTREMSKRCVISVHSLWAAGQGEFKSWGYCTSDGRARERESIWHACTLDRQW